MSLDLVRLPCSQVYFFLFVCFFYTQKCILYKRPCVIVRISKSQLGFSIHIALCAVSSHSVWLFCQDYLRPSVESILQNSLISGYVAQEQKRLQEKQRRRSVDVEQPKHPEPSLLAELRLKEQILREREQTLKEREQRLERKSTLFYQASLHLELTSASNHSWSGDKHWDT